MTPGKYLPVLTSIGNQLTSSHRNPTVHAESRSQSDNFRCDTFCGFHISTQCDTFPPGHNPRTGCVWFPVHPAAVLVRRVRIVAVPSSGPPEVRQSVPGDILSSKASPGDDGGGGGGDYGDTRRDGCTGDHSSATTFEDRNRTRQMELDSRFEITEELQKCSAKSLLPVRLNKWYKYFFGREK